MCVCIYIRLSIAAPVCNIRSLVSSYTFALEQTGDNMKFLLSPVCQMYHRQSRMIEILTSSDGFECFIVEALMQDF